MEEKESLGQRIRRIRTDRGMSLAAVVGDDFSRAFLNQVEMGKARPSIRVLRIIADRLGTEVEYLLQGREAGIERELAVEKARVLLLQGDPRRALIAIRPAVNSYDWPLGTDARLAHAQALIALGRKEEAAPIIARERSTILFWPPAVCGTEQKIFPCSLKSRRMRLAQFTLTTTCTSGG